MIRGSEQMFDLGPNPGSLEFGVRKSSVDYLLSARTRDVPSPHGPEMGCTFLHTLTDVQQLTPCNFFLAHRAVYLQQTGKMRARSEVEHVLSDLEIARLRENFTARETTDEHFFRCWQRQDCKSCLKENQCGWCPMVSLPCLTSRARRDG